MDCGESTGGILDRRDVPWFIALQETPRISTAKTFAIVQCSIPHPVYGKESKQSITFSVDKLLILLKLIV